LNGSDSRLFKFDPLRHVPSTNIQGKCHETTEEKSSAKRMKQEITPIKDFYQGYVECTDVKIDLPIEDFYGEQDSIKKLSVKKGVNMQKHHKQLSNHPWNQGHQKNLVDI
jgi:hypothetical protein